MYSSGEKCVPNFGIIYYKWNVWAESNCVEEKTIVVLLQKRYTVFYKCRGMRSGGINEYNIG